MPPRIRYGFTTLSARPTKTMPQMARNSAAPGRPERYTMSAAPSVDRARAHRGHEADEEGDEAEEHRVRDPGQQVADKGHRGLDGGGRDRRDQHGDRHLAEVGEQGEGLLSAAGEGPPPPSSRAAARPRAGRRRRSASSPSGRARSRWPDTNAPHRGRRAAALRARDLRSAPRVLRAGAPGSSAPRSAWAREGRPPGRRRLRCAGCAGRRTRRPRPPGRARRASQARGRITTSSTVRVATPEASLRRPPIRAASRS